MRAGLRAKNSAKGTVSIRHGSHEAPPSDIIAMVPRVFSGELRRRRAASYEFEHPLCIEVSKSARSSASSFHPRNLLISRLFVSGLTLVLLITPYS